MRATITILATIAAANFAHGQYGPVPQQPNAPFSADEITTQVQTLADGTHITQPEQTTKLYRDSLGRTRSEAYHSSGGAQGGQPTLTNITIVDPVEGARYLLNPNNKTAQKILLPKQSQSPFPATLPPAMSQALAGRPPGTAVQATPSGVTYVANAHPLGMGDSNAPPLKTESLGTQTIEGVTAEGRRTTTTYAVGKMGNDREIVTSFETWQSPELGMMTVLTKNSDPRTGERTMRIANLSRTEPDPSLFVVPPDYTIEEAPIPGSQGRATGSAH
jgi:hypothetical protein